MTAPGDIKIAVRTNGLDDLRRVEGLLASIEMRISRINERAQQLGIPISVLLERTEEEA